MTKIRQIRLDRPLNLEWLDAVASLVAAGADLMVTRAKLFELLDAALSGGTKRGTSCYKTVGVLSGCWANVPRDLVAFRDRAISIFREVVPPERMALHWAMLMANYGFFADVARIAGRLLSLQGNVTLSQITHRMHESWGERSTVTRATRRMVRSMVQWGAMADTGDRGVYTRSPERIVVPKRLTEILLEGLLRCEGRGLPVSQVGRHPALFPFELVLRSYDVRQSPLFEIDREGLNIDMVQLATRGGSGNCVGDLPVATTSAPVNSR